MRRERPTGIMEKTMDRKTPGVAAMVLGLSLTILASPAVGDALQLKDGRLIEGKPMKRVNGGVAIQFKHGEVFVPDAMIIDLFLENPDGSFKPRNEAEAEKLAKGLIPFDGKWISRNRYQKIRSRQIAAYKDRIEEAKAHRKWRNRYTDTTRNFAFEYTIPKATAEEFMDLFEVYFKEFNKKWGVRRGRKPKLKVCFHCDEAKFRRNSGAGYGVLGYFRFVEPIELNVYNIRNDKEMTIGVIFHEVNHYLFHLIDPKFHYPPWVGEGLAEYYGSSHWDPRKKKLSVGHLQEGRLVSLKDDVEEGEWLTLKEMIGMESASIKHYTWGWSFCHFLLQTPRYAKKFQRFVKHLPTSRSIQRKPFNADMKTVGPDETMKALKKCLGVKDLNKLEEEWHAYIKKNLKTQSGRGYVEAARMAWRNAMPLTAEEYYEKAIKAGYRSHKGFFGYAKLLLNRKRNDKASVTKAIGLFEKALEIDPLDAYSYIYMGRAYQALGGKENRTKAERYVRLAHEIDPYDDELEAIAEKLGIDVGES
jgi:tetratricopeptide (TPR) repeat protein